jgi:ribonuclease HI
MDDHELPRGVASVDSSRVVVHFDGACEPPKGGGIATFGFIIDGGGLYHEDMGLAVRPYSPRATNNVAEYVAAIRALEWLLREGFQGEVLLVGDSQLVIRQMEGSYQVRAEHLKAYHQHLSELRRRFARVEFQWVPREENQFADRLSKQALEEARQEAAGYRPEHPVDVSDETELSEDGANEPGHGEGQFHRTV